MHITSSLIVACIVLSAVLENTAALPASASGPSGISHGARGMQRREISFINPASDTTLQKRQGPSSGMSTAVIDKISVGLASTIAKFSSAKEAGASLPTLEEMTQTVGDALKSSDTNNRGQSSRAVKAALDALADQKLAEAHSGGSKLSTRQARGPAPKITDEAVSKISAALLETITKFVNEKQEGGPLPTAAEISTVLSATLKKVDLRNRTQSAEAFKSGLDALADEKMTEAHQHSGSSKPAAIDVQKRQAPSSGMSTAAIDKISVGLASTIAKFSVAHEAGAPLPTLEEMTRTVGDALRSSDTNNRGQSSRAVKSALDALADRELAEAHSGGSKLATRQARGPAPKITDEAISKISAALLETITKFVNEKQEGGPLPTAAEISTVLSATLKKVDLRNRTQSAEAFKSGLDALADEKMTEAHQHSGSSKPAAIEVQKRQAPSSGMSTAAIDKISVGLASTIAKFSAAKEAGASLPTLEEMTQTVGEALRSSDTNNRGQSSRAVKSALDALADRELAGAQSGGSKLVTRQARGPAPKITDEAVSKISAALLETITKFVNEKQEGGPLPTAAEISTVLSATLKKVDLRNRTQSAEAFKSGLDALADEKMTEAHQHSGTQQTSN